MRFFSKNFLPRWAQLILSLLFAQLAGVLGGIATFSSVRTWYTTLEKPFFNPPSWLFGPVWTSLYLLMGISLYLIWRQDDSQPKKTALQWFWVQWALNTAWSFSFFGLQSPGLGIINIGLLLVAILFTIRHFQALSKPSGYLFYPYLAWVSFATLLNASLLYLNGW